MITAIDHIALAVRDLDAAVDGYRRLLGREPNWLGGDGGARHAWFQLDNMALDIITPDGAGAFGDVIRAHLQRHGEGIWAIAFTASDVAAAVKQLARRGVRASEPGPTRSTHIDGRKRYWTTSSLNPDDAGGVQILLVDPPRDGQPWPRSPASGEAAVQALDHVVIHTHHPDRALGLYGAKLGLDLRVDRTVAAAGARMLFFTCGGAVVEIVSELNPVSVTQIDRCDGLAWRVGDAAATQARLLAAGLEPSDVRSGRKPGSKVFTVREGVVGAPTLIIEQGVRAA